MDGKNLTKYVTLLDTGAGETIEKKSVFIAHATPVKSEEEANMVINAKKKQYADARHNVYAYLLANGYAKYSDDGEPQGTAGLPILQLFKTLGFCDAVVVVTRYFGGTLLGTGGLIRAYTDAAKKAIMDAKIVEYSRFIEFSLDCSYSEYQKILPILSAFSVKTDCSDFTEFVKLSLAATEEDFEKFCRHIEETFAAKLTVKKLGERYDFVV